MILSIVGVDQVPALDYYRAKALQEDLLRHGPTPYSIVRATQFFEFIEPTISMTSDASTVRLPATRIQPIASADVVDAVVEVATGAPLNGIWIVAGPDVFRLDELGRIALAAHHDGRTVITDDRAGMFAAVSGNVLTAGTGGAPGAHALSGLDPQSRLEACVHSQPAYRDCPRLASSDQGAKYAHTTHAD